MKITGTRTYLELRVGSHQSVEVVLQLRRADVPWFERNCSVLQPELFELLQTSVLPRLFASEIEENHAKITEQKPPPNLGPGGIEITIGEKNSKEQKKARATASNNNSNKRKRGLSKKKQAELKRQQEEAAREQRTKERDVYSAVGETIRIAYRLEAARAGATLLFRNNNSNGNGKTGSGFRALKKLSKRILVWCYPANAQQPVSEGFLRPEVLPIASLFRMPTSETTTANTKTSKEVVELDADDDDDDDC